jgi:hypothetical protein
LTEQGRRDVTAEVREEGLVEEGDEVTLLDAAGRSRGEDARDEVAARLGAGALRAPSPEHPGAGALFRVVVGRLDALGIEEAEHRASVTEEVAAQRGPATVLVLLGATGAEGLEGLDEGPGRGHERVASELAALEGMPGVEEAVCALERRAGGLDPLGAGVDDRLQVPEEVGPAELAPERVEVAVGAPAIAVEDPAIAVGEPRLKLRGASAFVDGVAGKPAGTGDPEPPPRSTLADSVSPSSSSITRNA